MGGDGQGLRTPTPPDGSRICGSPPAHSPSGAWASRTTLLAGGGGSSQTVAPTPADSPPHGLLGRAGGAARRRAGRLSLLRQNNDTAPVWRRYGTSAGPWPTCGAPLARAGLEPGPGSRSRAPRRRVVSSACVFAVPGCSCRRCQDPTFETASPTRSGPEHRHRHRHRDQHRHKHKHEHRHNHQHQHQHQHRLRHLHGSGSRFFGSGSNSSCVPAPTLGRRPREPARPALCPSTAALRSRAECVSQRRRHRPRRGSPITTPGTSCGS